MKKECRNYETNIGEKGNKYNKFIKNKLIMSKVWDKNTVVGKLCSEQVIMKYTLQNSEKKSEIWKKSSEMLPKLILACSDAECEHHFDVLSQ